MSSKKSKDKNNNKIKKRSKNKSRKINYYNMKKIDYIMKRKNYFSLNRYKKSPKNKKNKNPTETYFQKIKNEIKKLNKENEIIENKYKNLPISNDELNDIIYRKTHNYLNNPLNNIDYKQNSEKIKKNIGLISKKIIDDLLYECIGDLAYIEKQKSENNEKKRLMNKLNITKLNLEEYNDKEKELISKYNIKKIKEIKENEIKNKENKINIYPIKNKFVAELNNDIIEKCDFHQVKFLEYMILHGCFYSDYNIFDIYDTFIEEMSEKIMNQEIDSMLKKADVLVEKMCDNEIKEIKDVNNQ